MADIPLGYKVDERGVRYYPSSRRPVVIPDALMGWLMCGTCGRLWDDSQVTSVTPAPAGRCPFEHRHRST